MGMPLPCELPGAWSSQTPAIWPLIYLTARISNSSRWITLITGRKAV